MKTRKILIVQPNWQAYTETFIQNLTSGLSLELDVWHTGYSPRYNTLGNRLYNYKFNYYIKKYVSIILANQLKRNEYYKKLKIIKPQLVYAHYGPTAAEMVTACKQLNIPLYVHFHGLDAWCYDLLKEYNNYKILWENQVQAVVPSKAMAEQLIQMGAGAHQVKQIPYGVNPQLFLPKTEIKSQRLTAVCRLVEKKNPLGLVRAFHQIHPNFPKAKLYLVGDGPLRGEVESLVQKMGLQKNIFLAGAQSQSVVVEHLQQSQVFIQFSQTADNGDREGLPVATLEALSCALPVVGTRHSGIPEIVRPGETGILIDEKNEDQLADALEFLLKNPKICREYGENGRNLILQNYTDKLYVQRIKELITAHLS